MRSVEPKELMMLEKIVSLTRSLFKYGRIDKEKNKNGTGAHGRCALSEFATQGQ